MSDVCIFYFTDNNYVWLILWLEDQNYPKGEIQDYGIEPSVGRCMYGDHEIWPLDQL